MSQIDNILNAIEQIAGALRTIADTVPAASSMKFHASEIMNQVNQARNVPADSEPASAARSSKSD